jgi:multisubunit Na+/H+ antiporter MnhC subunit
MGQTPAATVNEIEETRRRLDAELEELETYLSPTTDRMRRTAIIVGVAMTVVALIGLVMRRRAKTESIRRLREIDRRLERMEQRQRV